MIRIIPTLIYLFTLSSLLDFDGMNQQAIATDFTHGDHLWWKGSKLAKGMLKS